MMWHAAMTWAKGHGWEVMLAVVAEVSIVAASGELWRRGRMGWHSHRVRRFWKRFVGYEKVRIYVNERRIEGTGHAANTGRKVGDGYYLTKGMAAAAWTIERFAVEHLVKRGKGKVDIEGSVTGPGLNVACIVSLGSCDNTQTDHLLTMVRNSFASDFVVTPERLEMNNQKLMPEIDDDGTGHDYALVVRASLDGAEPVREVLIIAGLHMYGTEGAAMALTNESSLRSISATIPFDNCAFVLRVDVTRHEPSVGRLELDFDRGDRLIAELGRKVRLGGGQPITRQRQARPY
jgi:hypothetical protein